MRENAKDAALPRLLHRTQTLFLTRLATATAEHSEGGETDEDVDHPLNDWHATEDRSNQIPVEETNKAPVDCADKHKGRS